ncbi:MAG: class I SAM-dependent methyltransferase [Mycobacteriaceae bacterium]
MVHDFGKDYWEKHWQQRSVDIPGVTSSNSLNPYLIRGANPLTPGLALDAGCGAGAEAIWLASQGWQVTAVDISSDVLAKAAQQEANQGLGQQIQWIEADLTQWKPDKKFDLVTTHYAHPAIPQLEFYQRISSWVTCGGTLLIVGHMHTNGHGQQHPAHASVTVAEVVEVLEENLWEIVVAEECVRTVDSHGGQQFSLNDVVVQVKRRS